MNNSRQNFDHHAISMAETAVIIHEFLLDTPDSSAHRDWKKYIEKNGISEGRTRLVEFAVKIENVWSESENLGIEQHKIFEKNFECYDLDFIPRLVRWCDGLKVDGSHWWAIDAQLIRLFTLDPYDQ